MSEERETHTVRSVRETEYKFEECSLYQMFVACCVLVGGRDISYKYFGKEIYWG